MTSAEILRRTSGRRRGSSGEIRVAMKGGRAREEEAPEWCVRGQGGKDVRRDGWS